MAKHTTIYMNDETDKLVKELNINLSGFVNEELPKRYATLEYLRTEIKLTENRLKDLKNQYKFLTEKKKKFKLSANAIKDLMEMNKKLKKDPVFFDGMLKRFKNVYKYLDLTRSGFIQLLQKYDKK